jgi:hypothetical protein
MPRRGEARRDVDPSETEPKSDCDTKKKSAFSVCASPKKKRAKIGTVIGPRRFYRVQNAS